MCCVGDADDFLKMCVYVSHPWCMCSAVHQALSQQACHHLQLLLSLSDVWVQLEDFLEVTAGGQVVLVRGHTQTQYKRTYKIKLGEKLIIMSERNGQPDPNVTSLKESVYHL